MDKIRYRQLAPEHFSQVVELGVSVHGENYLDAKSMESLYQQSFQKNINASWVALLNEQVIAFRLTIAPVNWQIDRWCSPTKWQVSKQQLCYFKCNTVDANYRGKGLGSHLLKLSIEQARLQGCVAGLAHIWLASPGNSAFEYFSKNGGTLIKHHPNKWRDSALHDGYCCPVCPEMCECVAAEMILHFNSP
jgi:GNAT superfamily N-acetyltransferase